MELLRGARFWLFAWIFGAALWLVLVDSPKLAELAAGAFVAALGATGAELVRRQRVAGIALRVRFVRRAPALLAAAVSDVGRLTIAAFAQLVRPRPVRGRVVAIPFRHGGDEPDATGRRALAIGLGSFAPNSIMIGIDSEADRLLVHQLDPTRDPSDLDPLCLR